MKIMEMELIDWILLLVSIIFHTLCVLWFIAGIIFGCWDSIISSVICFFILFIFSSEYFAD
jgi:hypothetical protein